MDKYSNCDIPYKVNGMCVYRGIFRNKLIYKLKCLLCEAIYKDNIQQKFKKTLDGHFSNLLRLLKKGQKPDSFATYF